MNQNKIGEIIEKRRKEKNLTQKELADLLGVSNTAISKWENGNNLPDISMLEPLCNILDLDLLNLISIQNSAHEDNSKKFTKVRKAKLYRTITLSIIFISILCITNLYTYNKLMVRRKEDLRKSVEVYKISSKDKDFRIDGYAIFNEKENIIFLEKIIYQGEDNFNIDYKNLTSATYYIKIDDRYILTHEINLEDEKIKTIHNLLEQINTTSYPTEVDLKKYKGKFHKISFKITLKEKNNNKGIILVDLQLTKMFR